MCSTRKVFSCRSTYKNPDPQDVRSGPESRTSNGDITDVSLWYLIRGDSSRAIEFDRGEFHGVRWFGIDEIPFERSDPHMRRFVEKLRAVTCRESGLE